MVCSPDVDWRRCELSRNPVRYTFLLMENEVVPTRPWWMLPPGHLSPLWWVGIGAGLVWATYLAGPDARFPVLYVLPVSVAAWYSGRRTAVTMSVVVTAANLVFLVAMWPASNGFASDVAEHCFRGSVITLMGLWFARLAEHERQLHRYVLKLEGLLPICSFCKSIRNEAGAWERLETFVSTRSDAQFSHGLCPSCVRDHYSVRS
jgi:hypothetical protein